MRGAPWPAPPFLRRPRRFALSPEPKSIKVGCGDEGKFKFIDGSDKCLGFDDFEEDEEAIAVDCHSSRAAEFRYRSDLLLELEEDDDLCLEGIELKDCNRRERDQRWLFVRQAADGRDYGYDPLYRCVRWQLPVDRPMP